jgi:hypothetical protein
MQRGLAQRSNCVTIYRDSCRPAVKAMLLALACLAGDCSISVGFGDDGSPAPLVQSIKSGAWSSLATWQNGRTPTTGDRVLVSQGHEVLYDVVSEDVIRVVKVAGTLRFATDRDTRLEVGLLRVEAGQDVTEEGFDCHDPAASADPTQPRPTLEIGSANDPIGAEHTALVRLTYCEGMDKESCPALISCGGRMELHGAPMNRTWVKLGAELREGATEIVLAEPVVGWRAGQRLLIPSTARLGLFRYRDGKQEVIPTVRDDSRTEERTIASVFENKVVVDKPVRFDHKCDGAYRGEVAVLGRNVIVESADPAGIRGHTMYHSQSTGSISYAEFRHLGKRGVLGRYALHFHLCRDTMRGGYVIGASIHDSDNRWLTVHGTDYLVVRDCVGYNSLGHGFFLEDGTEVFNIFDRNLAVQARHAAPLPKQVLPFDENEGAGFWWSNSLNSFTRNVAVECDQYGYRFEATKIADFDPTLEVPGPDGALRKVDVRTLPFVRFQDNEAHSHRRFAFNLGGIRHVSDQADYETIHTAGADRSRIQGGDVLGVGPDSRHPFMIKNYLVWNSHWVFHGGSPNVWIDGLDATDCVYGIFKTRVDGHEYRNLSLKRIDTADFFEPWGSSSLVENYERYLDPVDDLPPTTVITHCRRLNSGRLEVRGSTADNGPVKRVTVNNREVYPLRENFAEWRITLDKAPAESTELIARAADSAGNIEPVPHRRQVREFLSVEPTSVAQP